jgi:hypothetical protein
MVRSLPHVRLMPDTCAASPHLSLIVSFPATPFSRRQVSNGAEATANMGEPSEREALLTILLDIPARECLVVISLWGAKELVVLFCQLKAGRIYTYGLFVHVSMRM